MSWLDPSTRHALTWQTFTRELLPPIVLYYVTALLVIRARTFPIRLALLPITLYGAFRCATRLDIVKGYERLAYLNQGLVLAMTTLGTRCSIWTFQLSPYLRLKHSSGSPALDALDLCFNLRGLGWSWSAGLKVPRETRNTASKPAFLRATLASFVLNVLLFDCTLFAVQSFRLSPLDDDSQSFGSSPAGASIFASSLSPPLRYFRSSLIALLSGLVVYYSILSLYFLLTLLSITFLRHSPEQWPPLFHRPWFSTSLNEFWACRWHQVFRHLFIASGGVPGVYLLGRVGGVGGVFLASGLLHYFGLWGMGRGTDFLTVAGFFLMMGVGTIAEYAWKRLTGNRVGGVAGWAWSMVWVLGWGNMLVDAWLVRGLAGSVFTPQEQRPSLLVVRWLRDSGYWLEETGI